MKRNFVAAFGFVLILILGSINWTSCSKKVVPADSVQNTPPPSQSAPVTPPPPPSPSATTPPSGPPPFIAAIQEQIKGKEDLPAEQVFENITTLKGIPAGKILPIMMEGFNKSLGVRCNHCHARGNWASDENPKKELAREMWKMTGTINKQLLAGIKGLESENPVVNCGTCHRGKAIPSTEEEKKG